MNRTIQVKPADDLASELEGYGTGRGATDHFEIGAYRYSRLEDAIAEARRRGRVPGDGS